MAVRIRGVKTSGQVPSAAQWFQIIVMRGAVAELGSKLPCFLYKVSENTVISPHLCDGFETHDDGA